jgi:diguanylate cyclase (GGDEF)-like protein/PAS domain S-box-containing protein
MTSTQPLHALILEDSPEDAELLISELRRAGFAVEWRRVDSEADYTAQLSPKLDVIFADYALPQFDPLRALELLRQKGLEIPFIIVSGSIGEDRAVAAMREGAWDYLLKDRLGRLGQATQQALEKKRLQDERRQAQAALQAREEQLRLLVNHIPEVFWTTDIKQEQSFYVSPAYKTIWGRSRRELKRDPTAWMKAIHPEDRGRVSAAMEKLPGETYDEQYRIVRPDGSVRWIQDRAFPVANRAGRVYGIVGVAEDITERKQAQEKIARLSRVHAVLSGINSLIVRVRDRGALLEEACRIAREPGNFRMAWIGWLEETPLALIPVAWAEMDEALLSKIQFYPGDDAPESSRVESRALREKQAVFCNDISAEPALGTARETLLAQGCRSVIALPLLMENQAVGVFVLYAAEPDFFTDEERLLLNELGADISFALDYLAKEEKLRYLAYYDPLTGLSNRTLFYDHQNQMINASQRGNTLAAVILSDVENFRLINDTLGRHVGDTLLRVIAERIKGEFRSANNVARVGADCFAVMLSELRQETDVAHMVEEKILKLLAQPVRIGDQELRISVKVGIALFPNDGIDADTLFKNAEAALKRAKESKERYLFYAPEMNARAAERFALESRLRRAVEQGQFVLHYQPKISLANGRLKGLEALLRWNDPEMGLIPPGGFIPVLEETGMILEVGQWVLVQAVSDFQRWQTLGWTAPRIAVNVSAIQLRQKSFMARITQAIEQVGVPEHGLDLELTESLLMEDIGASIAKLRAIQEMEVRIAVDDFGTGYSSLSYIAKLPIHALKIDRSFIVNMTNTPEDMSIVSTIISLAHSFRLQVVAEGVESEEQARFLRLLRCDECQGYLFSPPVPIDRIEAMLVADPKPFSGIFDGQEHR